MVVIAMGKSARWLGLKNAAKVLGMTEQDVKDMVANGQLQTQTNGNVTEYRFDYDPKGKTKYTPVPIENPR